jgi:hypothetical protein
MARRDLNPGQRAILAVELKRDGDRDRRREAKTRQIPPVCHETRTGGALFETAT